MKLEKVKKKWLFQEIPAPKNTQAQVPWWPSNFAPGIKTEFKDFSEEIYKKTKTHRDKLILQQRAKQKLCSKND